MKTTVSVQIPKDPLDAIVGQEEAVKVARVVVKQRRHMLLVGPPGTGKSLIAQAIAQMLPKPKQEIAIVENPDSPEKPFVDIRAVNGLKKEKSRNSPQPHLLHANDAPYFVAERLGFRCPRCAGLSDPNIPICSSCGADKFKRARSPFDDLVYGIGPEPRMDRVFTSLKKPDGTEQPVVYERTGDGRIRMMDEKTAKEIEKTPPYKVIVPLERKTFIQATGASETELLGDVRHDPYGGHPEVGTAPYLRIIPGAVHEAHEGVLFIDELSTLGHLQRHLLTAMQEKKFPIMGRNPSSTGASVRVDDVPCDFVFVGALNTNDLTNILPPLRSRIMGNGYEVLVETVMPDNEKNQAQMVCFMAQEIRKDGRIPHADETGIHAFLEEARRRAKVIDDKQGLTLRLRDLSGLLRLAGDIAVMEETEFITEQHIEKAIKKSRSIEEQIQDTYSSWWKAGMSDYAKKTKTHASSDIA